MRKATAAGSFYPAEKEFLEKQIKESFLGNLGPKSLPPKKKGEAVIGTIVPHAGYVYSGQCAAHAYKAIAEAEKQDTFIVLGTNHTGYTESNFAISTQDFETPLGIVENDKEFSKLLLESGSKGKRFSAGETAGDKMAHQYEHSIEVQLPFLQFILKQFKIVPIIVMPHMTYESYKDFAKLIIDTAKKLKRNICVIASSDFTHFGMAYGFFPFSSDVKENLYKLDKDSIDSILEFNTKEFLAKAQETTICGAGAIALCIEICKQLKSKNAKLLKYYTSGDLSGDYNTAVGYASISFS